MAKRHTAQTDKQRLGQYFTTNADYILSGYESVVQGRSVIDPFAGGCDLLTWAEKNGASSTHAYDLDPKADHIQANDSIRTPPRYAGHLVVTNPPYLSRNKARGDKSVFDQWAESDLYKCHLASLSVDCDEAIEIVPSNFFCESRAGIRNRLFQTHYIVSAKYWNQPVFDDATTGVCVIHLRRGRREFQEFSMTLLPENKTVTVTLKPEWGYLYGEDFFRYIQVPAIQAVKTDQGMPPPNTCLVVGLLDRGARPVGLSFNDGEPIYSEPKAFTTYQLTLPDYELTAEQQRETVALFNRRLAEFRAQYHDLFLANYMGPAQKILSRVYVHQLLARVLQEQGIEPVGMARLFETVG